MIRILEVVEVQGISLKNMNGSLYFVLYDRVNDDHLRRVRISHEDGE
jgi:hypothetical protein